MSVLDVNGLGVISGEAQLPRSGLWTADLRVDSAVAIDGSVVLSFGDGALEMHGTVVRGSVYQDTTSVLVVGGAGGLRNVARPRHYGATSLRVVLGDLLREAGEQLSPSSATAVLAQRINGWTSEAIPLGRLLTRLIAEAPGAVWRALPDGSIWVGTESWPATSTAFDVLDSAPERGEALLGIEAVPPLPGTTLDLSVTSDPDLRLVSYVEYSLGAPGARARVYFEDAAPSKWDRLKDAIAGVVAQASGPIDYRAPYSARVVAQSGDTIDVQPDDPRLPSMGGVPLLVGFPGASVQMPAGGRVLVVWSAGDPARPYALAFDGDTRAAGITMSADQITLSGSGGLQTLGDYLRALAVALAAHVHVSAAPGNPTTPSATLQAEVPPPGGIGVPDFLG